MSDLVTTYDEVLAATHRAIREENERLDALTNGRKNWGPYSVLLPDLTFTTWVVDSLVWLADRGMGFLPAESIDYDDDYWEKYEGYAKTMLGRRLTVERIDFVERNILRTANGKVVDIGIGCGDFIERATESWGSQICGFDVSRRACEWLTDRGLYRDPYEKPVKVATFWDSLEHIVDAARLLANVTEWAFMSLPIVPGDGPPPKDWKHLRPGEHFWYWTRDGLIAWMLEQGFACVEHNTNESLAGREDIGSFAFRRIE